MLLLPRAPKPLDVDAVGAGLDEAKEEILLLLVEAKGELEPALLAEKGEALELAKAPKPELLKAESDVCSWSFPFVSVGVDV